MNLISANVKPLHATNVKKVGHIVPACKPQFKKQQIHNLETGYSDSSETDSEEYLCSQTDSNKGNRDAIYITPSINGKEIPMELDNGISNFTERL